MLFRSGFDLALCEFGLPIVLVNELTDGLLYVVGVSFHSLIFPSY